MEDFKISQFTGLEDIDKQMCSKCGRKRMYFCYDCRIYMPSTSAIAPTVELPYKIDIIKHRRERNGKSTALHAHFLAPASTTIFDAPNVTEYSDLTTENVVLVYPSDNAKTIPDFIRDKGPIDRFVFLDATWFQVGGLLMLPELKSLPHVRLDSYETLYWRPQKGSPKEYLATIEAIYYAVREAYQAMFPDSYDGRFDNLLFWFFYFRKMVNNNLITRNLRKRTDKVKSCRF